MDNTNSSAEDFDLTGLDKEERITLALEAYHKSQARTDLTPRQKLSLRKAAIVYDVPRGTLTDRSNGVPTRKEAHEKDKNLTNAQEAVLVEWVKSLGRRAVPLTAITLRDYASSICGFQVGEAWAPRFLNRHPDLKTRWTQSLESCRAKSVNRSSVEGFFKIYKEIIEQYQIPPENIYNCDEKGIQLGVGKRIKAIIDRDQKNIYNEEDGNREMVTVIETVCADGTALHPSIIFQGKRTNLAWGRNNPSKARRVISCSENGWTDQELGAKWLEWDFHPASSLRNHSGRHRLLILDGHNSHCTYRLCSFTEKKQIIIICLPSHTTHVLQPCDVAVFGPLATCWKSVVNKAMANGIVIDKYNLLEHYAVARERALKVSTITTAFMKTGIYPYDPSVIHPSLYEPSLNTTTKPAQPLPASIPSSLIASLESASLDRESAYTIKSNVTTLAFIPSTESTPSPSFAGPPASVPDTDTNSYDSDDDLETSTSVVAEFTIPIDLLIAHGTTLCEVQRQNETLITILKALCRQVQGDYIKMHLMDLENEKLRQKLFHKAEKRKKDKRITSEARHMTSDEVLDALAKAEFTSLIKLVYIEARPIFQERSRAILDHYKRLAVAEKARRKAEEQERKDKKRAEEQGEKEDERKRKAEERARLKAAKEQKAHETKIAKAAERKRKATEKMAIATRKAEEKRQKSKPFMNLDSSGSESSSNDAETDRGSSESEDSDSAQDNEAVAIDTRQRGMGRVQGHARGRGRGRGRAGGKGRGSGQHRVSEDTDTVTEALTPTIVAPPRPRPRPIPKKGTGLVPTAEPRAQDEEEGGSGAVASGSNVGVVVSNMSEEPVIAPPVGRYSLRSRR